MKIDGGTRQHSFTANTGTPQDDGLSPVPFTFYLENALRDVHLQPEHEFLPPDDVDFISMKEYRNVDDIQTNSNSSIRCQ